MRALVRTCTQIFRNSMITDLEYRFNYVIMIFSCVITVLMEVAILGYAFGDRETLGTLSRNMVVPFVVLGLFLRQTVSDWSFTQELVSEIREGTFRRYLIQPLHFPTYFFSYLSGTKVVHWALFAMGVLTLKFFLGYENIFSLPHFPWALLSIFLMIILTWQFYLIMVCLGFWIQEASFLMMAFNIGLGLLSGSLLPLDWLPVFIQNALKFTPFPLLGDIPLRMCLGTFPLTGLPHYLTISLFWIFSLAMVYKILWKAGTKRYEAFGG